MSVQLLAITTRPEDLDFLGKIAKNTGFPLISITSELQLAELLKTNVKSLLFWDLDHEAFDFETSATARRKVHPVIRSFLMPRYVFGLVSDSLFELSDNRKLETIGHYCVRNYDDFALEWMSRVCASLHSLNPFGLENYKDNDTLIQKVELKSSVERKAALEAVSRILARRGIPDRVLQMMIRSLDEILMNAVFNAPRDWSGRYYRKDLPRTSEFTFLEKEKITLSMIFNKNFVALSILDHFGSFSTKIAWELICRDYQKSSYSAADKIKGAGLGLQGIIGSGVSLLISCRPDMETEAVLAFPYYKNYKQTRSSFRSFSFNIRGRKAQT